MVVGSGVPEVGEVVGGFEEINWRECGSGNSERLTLRERMVEVRAARAAATRLRALLAGLMALVIIAAGLWLAAVAVGSCLR